MIGFVIGVLLMIVASILLQGYIVSHMKTYIRKGFALTGNVVWSTIGITIVSFLSTDNGKPTDGGMASFLYGTATTLITLIVFYTLLFLSLLIQLFQSRKKQKKS